MLCEGLLHQIVELARYQVRTGRTTERRLASLAGVSQPHLHNVLKGIRQLSPESGDKILRSLNLSVPDILWWHPGEVEPGTISIPILRDRVGPGSRVDWDARRGYLALPRTLTGRLTDPVAIRLAPDSAMPGQFRANDLVVIDRDPRLIETPAPGWCWVVAEAGGLRVRYLQRGEQGLVVASEPSFGRAPEWRVPQGQNPKELIRGRIVWTSRELEAAPSRSPGSAGGGY